MRKIESLMNEAIIEALNWKSGNTEVVSEGKISRVFLHGNQIATIGENFIQLFDGKHQTATTKSRLNAILFAHGIDGERVFQKAGQWFLNSKQFGTIPFFSGMRLNWLTLKHHTFLIMTVSEFASLSTLDLTIAEVQGKVKVTRLETIKPRKSDLILSQTKGNRCRTNRSSGTNFVTQVR